MKRDVFLIKTEHGYVADHATQCYTEDPEQAVSFTYIDAAAKRAQEFSYLKGVACSLHIHQQPFPRPVTPTSHATQVSKISPRD